MAQISPSAAPADTAAAANIAAAAPRYWVEFGAYEVGIYADELKQSLGQLDIRVTVNRVPGKYGRHYLQVRTAGDSDHATAAAQLAKAATALHIRPLLHRVPSMMPAPAQTRVPEARAPEAHPPVAETAPATSGAYWVQFGAFRAHENAEDTLTELRKSGVQASVIERKDRDLKPLYVIRVSSLADRVQAEQLAQQGSAALHSHDVLIGESGSIAGSPPR